MGSTRAPRRCFPLFMARRSRHTWRQSVTAVRRRPHRNEDRVADSANKGRRPKGTKLAQAAGRYTGQGGARQTGPVPTGGGARGKKAGGRPGVRREATRRRRWINYPRAGKGPVMRWIPGWRFFLGSFLMLIILAVGAFAVAYAMIKSPTPASSP